jgi:DNA-binding CsgD family transcriptional regulator
MEAGSIAGAAGALIEREAELDAIERALAAAERGEGATVVVEGAAGMGKSVLLARAAEAASGAGVRVLAARTDMLERDFPFGVIRQLYEPPLRGASPAELERLLEGSARHAGEVLLHGAAPGRDASTLVAHSLYWLAWGLAAERPLLLLVDDAHWADRASARALLHLARRLDDLPIALVVAYRPAEPDAPEEITDRLTEWPGTTTLTLRPLSEAGTAGIVRGWNEAADHDLCARCHLASGGNPLVAREVVRILSEAGPDALAADGSLVDGARSPTLNRAVRRRMAGLTAPERAVAEVLAILGDGAAPAHIAAIAAIPIDEVPFTRDPLVAAGLLAEGEELVFSHPIMRQAVEASLPRGERAHRHRRAAELLLGDGADLDAVAAHLLLSDPAGDPATVATLRKAAGSALDRGAPETATAYLRRALEEPPAAGERSDVLVELATTEFDSGAPGAAERLRAALVGLEDHGRRIEVLTRLAALEVLQEGGKADAELFESERSAVGPEGELGLAMELAALDVLLMIPGRQLERQARVAALPPPPADPGPYDRVATAHRAWVAAERGDTPYEETAALALQALEGDTLLETSKRGIWYHLATRALIVADALPAAETALRRMEEKETRRGSLRMLAAVAWYLADLYLRAGRVADAENEARLVLSLNTEGDQVHGGAVEALVNTLVERGELNEADAVLREHGWDGPLGDQYREVGLRVARARLALARGDGETALAESLDCGRLREQQGRPNPSWTPWRSTAAIACLLIGDRERARALAEEELSLARAFGAPRAVGIALRARALVAEGEEALALHRESVDVLSESVAHLEHARALKDLGAALRMAGDLKGAREPLRLALAEADRLGAPALAGRAREQLVATGLRPRRAPITGVAALTPRQRRVCELAAAGRTNRESAQELFVTVKTIETHLLAAYRKLGIGSKSELAAALAADDQPR